MPYGLKYPNREKGLGNLLDAKKPMIARNRYQSALFLKVPIQTSFPKRSVKKKEGKHIRRPSIPKSIP